MLSLPSSNQEQGPHSAWFYEPEVDLCHWLPLVQTEAHDNSILIQEKWHQIDPEQDQQLVLLLAGQLAPLILSSGKVWAQEAVIARAEQMPVALSFHPSQQARLRLSDANLVLYFSQAYPPPQFGEAARILGKEGGRTYSLASLGPEARSILQQLSDILKALAAPAAWWPYDDLLAVCATQSGYEQRRSTLRQAQQSTQGVERRIFREQLLQLDQTYKQAQALQRMRAHHQQEPDRYQRLKQDAAQLTHQLIALYWKTHQVTKATSLSDGTAPPFTLQGTNLLVASHQEQEVSITNREPELLSPNEQEQRERLAILSRLEEERHTSDQIEVPSFQEDRAIREASLAGRKSWVVEEDRLLRYTASNDLAVYFSDPKRPMDIADALKRLPLLGESTVLTGRIALGLWNLRRFDARLNKNGDAAIRYDEILEWRGVQKHSRPAYPGTSNLVTDGYPDKLRKQVRADFELLQHYYLRGERAATDGNRSISFRVDGPYLRVGSVTVETLWEENDVGVFVSPGPWINTYDEADSYVLAQVDRRIFQLIPQNEQHELRLALYLVERWRQQAKQRTYDEPISMLDLLTASMIRIDRKHLTDRFADRIEGALKALQEYNIIRSYECLTPIDRQKKGHWGKEWLASLWRILPPGDLVRSYATKIDRSAKGRPLLPAPTEIPEPQEPPLSEDREHREIKATKLSSKSRHT